MIQFVDVIHPFRRIFALPTKEVHMIGALALHMSELIEHVLLIIELANQAVKAESHEVEAVNELEVSYTEGHKLSH